MSKGNIFSREEIFAEFIFTILSLNRENKFREMNHLWVDRENKFREISYR